MGLFTLVVCLGDLVKWEGLRIKERKNGTFGCVKVGD
jgi:hypothetical protein